jgi:hypothetical protein
MGKLETVTVNNVIDAFNSLGGNVNQVQALRALLEKQFSADDVTTAINEAIGTGQLTMDQRTGAIRKN